MKKSFLILFFIIPFSVSAQLSNRDSISWGEFMDYFLLNMADEDNVDKLQQIENELEELRANKIDLNSATRYDLLRIPFLDGAKADSIILYRDKKHQFYTLGELMFVNGLTYLDRHFLRFFLYCGEPQKKKVSFAEKLYSGKFELETRIDIPLYKREGYKHHTIIDLVSRPNIEYKGDALYNVTRFRYNWKNELEYGLTLEKDAGEPFASSDNYPYDYFSFFFHYKSPQKGNELFLGDYNVSIGQGLLFGGTFYNTRLMLLNGFNRYNTNLRAHKSTGEVDFFRGAAGKVNFGKMNLLAFISYRSLDASYTGDTIRTLQTTGYHRTFGEIDKENRVDNFTVGTRLGYEKNQFMIGATAYYSQYNKYISPKRTYYNENYFRGNEAAGISVDYSWTSEKWRIRGEAATDKDFHLAISNVFSYIPSDLWQFSIQQRSIASNFQSIYGDVMQEYSKTMNEHGGLFAIQTSAINYCDLTAYLDFFYLPKPVYHNYHSTAGMEAYMGLNYHKSENWTLSLNYKFKTKETGISNRLFIKQSVQTHRMNVRLDFNGNKFSFHPALSLNYRKPEKEEDAFGWMISARCGIKPSKRCDFGTFAALFFSDSYQTALYAYEPKLYKASYSPSLYYDGFRFAATANMLLAKNLHIAMKLGSTCYFNKSAIGTGAQRIDSSWKTDFSIQLRWTFNARKRK